MNTEFLQSEEWLALQAATGKETVSLSEEGCFMNGIVHTLPLVGSYLYVPRGPRGEISHFQSLVSKLMEEAKKRKCRWIRIEPENEEILEVIKKTTSAKAVPAPHDVQPREIFKIALGQSEEELLSSMKSKTRYNIRLAEKRGVRVFESRAEEHREAFLKLIIATTDRKGIVAHSRSYYEKFLTVLPETMCRLFVAEYQGIIIAANLVMFYGDTVTYLHGGTADIHRDVMAPYLLQWEQMKVAKREGFQCYDFGGIRTGEATHSWSGITKFKLGFSPTTAPVRFPGTYDIVLDSRWYLLYDGVRHVQALKRLVS